MLQQWAIVKGSSTKEKKQEARRAIVKLQRKLDKIKPKMTEKEFQQKREEYLANRKLI